MCVRRACKVDGVSVREAYRVFGLHRGAIRKMLDSPPTKNSADGVHTGLARTFCSLA